MDSDPVHYDEEQDAWFFWEETWADRQGPFNTREEAVQALSNYVRFLNGEDAPYMAL